MANLCCSRARRGLGCSCACGTLVVRPSTRPIALQGGRHSSDTCVSIETVELRKMNPRRVSTEATPERVNCRLVISARDLKEPVPDCNTRSLERLVLLSTGLILRRCVSNLSLPSESSGCQYAVSRGLRERPFPFVCHVRDVLRRAHLCRTRVLG